MQPTTLLDKLGLKSLGQMSDDELRQLVSKDRQNRTMVRAAGRIKRIAKDEAQPKTHKALPTLEATGLAPALIVKLRASGKSDAELIAILKARGVI